MEFIPAHFLEMTLVILIAISFLSGAVGYYLNTPNQAVTALIPGICWVFIVGFVLYSVFQVGGNFWQVTLVLILTSLVTLAIGVGLAQRKYREYWE